jgi:predicted nucleic acid-binding protein
VDTSVAAKWAVPEVDSAHARKLIDAVVPEGGRLWLLEIGLAEIVNVVWKYYYRGSASLDDARQMLAFLLTVPIQLAASAPLLAAAFDSRRNTECRCMMPCLFVSPTTVASRA